jgi:hypothetical protein
MFVPLLIAGLSACDGAVLHGRSGTFASKFVLTRARAYSKVVVPPGMLHPQEEIHRDTPFA